MTTSWQLSALMKKNFILMKRNWCTSCCEIFFPIILMMLLVLVRKAFKIEDYTLDKISDEDYIKKNSTALITAQVGNVSDWNGMTIRNSL